jgi:hypothetical protein
MAESMISIIIYCILGMGVAGGIGYLIWWATRPKKEWWTAHVYILSEGKRLLNDSKLELKDLRAYSMDVLEKKVTAQGVFFQLKKLKMPVSGFDPLAVTKWSKDLKEVDVLIQGTTASVLKRGFNASSKSAIVETLPHSRIEMMRAEIALRKDRLHNTKDILQAIAPFVIAMIMIFGLVGMTYIVVSGWTKMSQNYKDSTQILADAIIKFGEKPQIPNLGGNPVSGVGGSTQTVTVNGGASG